MRKQIQKIFSLLLLVVVLTTQVGLHLVHHHSDQEHSPAGTLSLHVDTHKHCGACGLDLFIAQELPSEFYFSFTPIQVDKLQTPATSATSFSIIFSSDRAPPVC